MGVVRVVQHKNGNTIIGTNHPFSNFLFLGPLTLLKIIKQTKELLLMCVTSIYIYHLRSKMRKKSKYWEADKPMVENMSFQYSNLFSEIVVVVQLLSHVRFFANPWTEACQAFLSFTISLSLLKLMSIESVMPSNHYIFCCPLLLLPSIFPSIRVFSIESVLCIMWPKYWSFSFSISPSNKYSELISFRFDWFDLLAFQGTLKCHLQHHILKA